MVTRLHPATTLQDNPLKRTHDMKTEQSKPLVVYKASAGSGKTFTLATEYIKRLAVNPYDYRSILAVFPTGGGKSLAFQLPALMAGENTSGLTVVISPLQSLMKDQVDNLENRNITEAVTINGLLDPIERAKAFERVEDGSAAILYIAPESLRSRSVERLLSGRKIVRFVIDEAHHALADTYRELWRRYPEAKKFGMTATPCRMNRRGFTDLFDTLITSDSIADFIRKGWLSAFDYVSIRTDSEDQRLIDGLEKCGTDGDYQIKEMNAVLNRRPTIERLYESVRQYADGKKGIVYAISISHARNIAAYYNNKGVNAVAIDSRTPAKERKRLVEDFRQGRIQVLVNVDVFSEGFDCPDVEFIQLARPTLSLAKYL